MVFYICFKGLTFQLENPPPDSDNKNNINNNLNSKNYD